MSSWGVEALKTERPVRRVRDEAKAKLAVVATSAVTCTLLAVVVSVLMKLVG